MKYATQRIEVVPGDIVSDSSNPLSMLKTYDPYKLIGELSSRGLKGYKLLTYIVILWKAGDRLDHTIYTSSVRKMLNISSNNMRLNIKELRHMGLIVPSVDGVDITPGKNLPQRSYQVRFPVWKEGEQLLENWVKRGKSDNPNKM